MTISSHRKAGTQMYSSTLYILIIMCFTNLIQILPSETDLNTPRSTFINNTSRHITIGNASRHAYTSKQLSAIYDHVKPTSLTNLPFGPIRGIRELRLNKKSRSRRNKKYQHLKPCRKAEIRNLREVPTVDKNNDEIIQTIWISTVNARFLKHKENLISEEILNNNTEIAVILKTWLKTPMKMILGHSQQN